LIDPEREAIGVAAQGIALAAWLMARKFTLVATNVPYLARGKQDDVLRDYIEHVQPAAKADLATAFVDRCLGYCSPGGSTALVTPQNWLFLGSYKALREWMLRHVMWDVVAKLGPGAFETITGEVVNVALMIHTAAEPGDGHRLKGLDASKPRVPTEKARQLQREELRTTLQSSQLRNPDSRISYESLGDEILLNKYAHSYNGMTIGDQPRLKLGFWEVGINDDWVVLQSTTEGSLEAGGLEHLLFWCNGNGPLNDLPGGFRRGEKIWGKKGGNRSRPSAVVSGMIVFLL